MHQQLLIIRHDKQGAVNHMHISAFLGHLHEGFQECVFTHSQQTATGDTSLKMKMNYCKRQLFAFK